MTAVSHQVVGLIDIPSDAGWSADAIVRECLGMSPRIRERDQTAFTRRVGASCGFEMDPVDADFSRLRADLDQLLEDFLICCHE